MVLSNLSLRNFRIHLSSALQFSNNLNFIVGGNGEGKTTLLEAVYFLCTTKNYKGSADTELTGFGGPGYELQATFEDNLIRKSRIVYSAEENRRKYFLDGKLVTRSVEIIGKFPVVLLTPDDHQLTQGSPSDRRKFVDSVVSQFNPQYLHSLIEYGRILKQRGSLLSLLREQRRPDFLAELDAWDEQLLNHGTQIILQRRSFLAEFESFIEEAYSYIMEAEETPAISYDVFDPSDGDGLKAAFAARLKQRREEEIRRASNLTGPHRDDFIFSVNGRSLKTYGSQGQHKTFQAALRFAEFFYLRQKTGSSPVFLLDDVFGELDTRRSLRISGYLKTVGQAFITVTDFSNYRFLTKQDNDLLMMVKQGVVTYA